MEGLPLLPGYSIHDPSKCQFSVPHNLEWKNGYPVVKKPDVGIGGQPLVTQGVLHSRSVDPVRYDPSLTYGRTKNYVPPKFQPHFLLYSNKCLTFRAFFQQQVFGSQEETFRIRKVNIIYFLEDDTITIMEPKVENAGFLQGRIVKRARIPKNDMGDCWHWKDINVGIDMAIYGVIYHITSCDNYTRAWLESQGVDVEPDAEMPNDIFTNERQIMNKPKARITPSDFDKKKRFLVYDKRVLRFYAIWDNRSSPFGELGKFIIHYYLVDETIDIIQEPKRELINTFQSNAILKRKKVRKENDEADEVTDINVDDMPRYYRPDDFICGKKVRMMGRTFYLYDCDDYTRQFYRSVYQIEQPKIELPEESKPEPKKQPLPPYTGFGSHEDSMLSYLYLDPLSVKNTNKMDFIRYVQNTNKKLRYTAVMDYVHPEDSDRQFIIEYRISDGTMMIHELRQRNSGFKGGRFLRHSQVPKPGTNRDNPEYYSPKDFRIGDVIDVYGHRFRLTGVDLAVYRYMEANPEKFDEEMLSEVRRHLTREGYLTEDIKDVAEFRKREEVAEPVMGDDKGENPQQELGERKVVFKDSEAR